MPETGKILRGCRAMWLKVGNASTYTLLGKDTDSLSIELNPDTETKKNVLGETVTEHNGYAPTLSNDSYIARKEDSIYPVLQKIVNELSKDDATCGGEMIVATLTDEVKNATGDVTLTGSGYKVPVLVVTNSDGGGTTGYGIPFTVSENGGRTQGSVSVTEKQPVFTAGSASTQSLSGDDD